MRTLDATRGPLPHKGHYGCSPIRYIGVMPKYLPQGLRIEVSTVRVELKRCRTCDQEKPLADYYANGGGMPGRRSNCIACHKAKRRQQYVKAGGSAVPHAEVLKREYGMTPADYEAMLRRQAHRCGVCRRPETKRSSKTGVVYRLAVDHDHVTGLVRGLLCHRCNQIVWALEENHTTLGAIGEYLAEFRAVVAGGVSSAVGRQTLAEVVAERDALAAELAALRGGL